MPTNIRITKAATLADIHGYIEEIERADAAEIHVWLPRDSGPQLFKDSWVSALLATTARRSSLVVRDWVQDTHSTDQQELRRFTQELDGVAALTHAATILNATGARVPLSPEGLAASLISRLGVLETAPEGEPASAASLTICALDHQAPEPLVIGGVHSKAKFTTDFLAIRNRYLDRALGSGRRPPTDVETDRALAGFVYEIFQNAFEHGRIDEEASSLKGIRFLRLRKHIHYRADEFRDRAAGFPPLSAYLLTVLSTMHHPVFYEVSLSDHGIGIVRRFLATRRDISLVDDSRSARTELVNRIIAENLSSKSNQPGAGVGLRRALEAVEALRGFVSIRTDRLWLYRAYGVPDSTGDRSLLPVVDAPLPYIAGTHVNMLFPAR